MFRMFRWPYPRSNRPLCVFLESFVTPGARLIVRWTHNKHVSPRLRVLSMESLMDSIHQPKTQSRSPVPESVPDTSNSNRNIGQRDIRFLFRIAAILDGRSLARSSSPSSVHGNSLYLYIVFFSVFIFSFCCLLGRAWVVPFEAFSQHRTKGKPDNVHSNPSDASSCCCSAAA